ncbi:MAG: zinc metallopeptidase, partial [Solirubrobacteraceae bacterium]|nr:zinc metallopeptidase [Solirubrobacteraceae bacterium]
MLALLWLLLLVPLAAGLAAQQRVQDEFARWRRVPNRLRVTGATVARSLLDAQGLRGGADRARAGRAHRPRRRRGRRPAPVAAGGRGERRGAGDRRPRGLPRPPGRDRQPRLPAAAGDRRAAGRAGPVHVAVLRRRLLARDPAPHGRIDRLRRRPGRDRLTRRRSVGRPRPRRDRRASRRIGTARSLR